MRYIMGQRTIQNNVKGPELQSPKCDQLSPKKTNLEYKTNKLQIELNVETNFRIKKFNFKSITSSQDELKSRQVSLQSDHQNLIQTSTSVKNFTRKDIKRDNFTDKQYISQLIIQSPRVQSLFKKNTSPHFTDQKQEGAKYYLDEVKQAFSNEKSNDQTQKLFREHFIEQFQTLKQTKNLIQLPFHEIQSRLLKMNNFNCLLPNNKTIIIDLDETLVHVENINTKPYDVKLPIRHMNNQYFSAYVSLRPDCRLFLEELSSLCEIVLFTASHKSYAQKIISYIDPSCKYFSKMIFRESCIKASNGKKIKDLRIIPRDLKNMVIIDNLTSCFTNQLDNGIPIIPFINDKSDTQLKKLMEFLKSHILDATDVRPVLRESFKLQIMSTFNTARIAVNQIY